MQFSDIIGQADTKQRLLKLVHEQRIPHALLLSGPKGIGKLQLAIAFAQYVNCPDRTDTEPCGKCPSCQQFENLQHPDLHFVFPIVNLSKSSDRTSVCDDFIENFRDQILQERYFSMNDWLSNLTNDNKQGLILASEADEMIRKLSHKAYQSEYKTMIIWLPEKMNITGANKILKLLEEPPSKTLFILASNAPDQLIQTIRSRVQEIRVPALTEAEISKALGMQDDELSLESRMAYAHMAQGSYLKALQLIRQDVTSSENLEDFIQIMRMAWLVAHKRSYDSLAKMRVWAEHMAKDYTRERQKSFLQNCQRLVRENFIYNLQHPEINYMTPSENDFSKNFAPFIHVHNVEDMVELFALAERHIEQNVNGKMVFFDVAVQLIILIKRK